MFSSGTTKLLLEIGDFAKYERSCIDQALYLRNLQVTAVRQRASAVLCDPNGRVLAYANAAGVISLADSTLGEIASLAASDSVPLVVPEDGFYVSAESTYYVSHGDVFELRAPDLPPCSGFRKVERLPTDAECLDVEDFDPSIPADAALFAYADAIDKIAEALYPE
ncbi:MAG: hypothetical protein H6710_13040 [Myxococcales bacterium]|nr:hypothetical protein [Myxococcales bacterium]MCB9705340.1 hypothetical protein [Myxococcales bacterium]